MGEKLDICVNGVEISLRIPSFIDSSPVTAYAVIIHGGQSVPAFYGAPLFLSGSAVSTISESRQMTFKKVDMFLSAYNPNAAGDKKQLLRQINNPLPVAVTERG